MKNKLGVIVPYRDRSKHLTKFTRALKKHLTSQGIDYELIVVEQADKRPFNRGKLLNIGFNKAVDLGCDYVALHDVDMIPIDVDYSKVDRPTHLATNFISHHGEKRVIFDGYFGGVTIFPVEDFLKLNGYSNNYWGWGYEDDDLLYRCKESFQDFNYKVVPNIARNTAGYKFNGHDSVIKIPKDTAPDSYTLLISIEPEQVNCRATELVDEYSILAIPGYDTGFSYNSFERYKFETWTTKNEVISLSTDITPATKCVLAATVDAYNKKICLYYNGSKVDEVTFEGRLKRYTDVKTILLGQTGSEENGRRPYKGVIDFVACWNHSLEPGQISAITSKLHLGVRENFEGYDNAHALAWAYDMKNGTNLTVLDVSQNEDNAVVHHCDRVEVSYDSQYIEKIIPWRRESTFELLPHKDNGFYENKWTYTETRKNQIRFFNKVLKGKTNWRRDGLSSLKYTLLSDNEILDTHYISCEL